MSKKIIVDFYRIELANVQTKFEQLLQKIIALPRKERTVDVRLTPINLYDASQDGDFWHGEITRIRMIDPPVKASRDGEVEDIPLDEDEGIGEKTAFLYHCSTRVLLLQTTHSGVSISTFLQYFQTICQNTRISADPILQPQAMKKLGQMHDIQKFEVRVAGLDNPGKLFQEDDLAIGTFQKIADDFCAPMMNITLSVGNKKDRSLSIDNVVRIAKNLVIKSSEQLEKPGGKQQKVNTIRITGSTMDSEENEATTKLFVDLLRDRMRERVDVRIQGRGNISYSIRIQALETAWQRREKEILALF